MATDENKPKTHSTGIIPGQFQSLNPAEVERQQRAQSGKSLPHAQQSGKGNASPSPFLEKLNAYLAVERFQWPGDPDSLPYVKELIEIEDYKFEWNTANDGADALESQVRRRRQELIQIICRDYPDTADKLLLHELLSPNAAASETTAIGRNIDALRRESGWSFNKLADETGIDKKSILSHVNKGVRPTPRILKEYAQAFSRALGRKIIAPDLEK